MNYILYYIYIVELVSLIYDYGWLFSYVCMFLAAGIALGAKLSGK